VACMQYGAITVCCQSIRPWTSAGPVSATKRFEWLISGCQIVGLHSGEGGIMCGIARERASRSLMWADMGWWNGEREY
jgi:hypothetical protein